MKGEYKVARECFEYLLTMPPPQRTLTDVVLAIALVEEEGGEMKEARGLLQQLLEQQITSKHSAQASQQLGWTIYRMSGRDKEGSGDDNGVALSMLNRARTLEPGDFLTHYYIGKASGGGRGM